MNDKELLRIKNGKVTEIVGTYLFLKRGVKEKILVNTCML